jgi:hypothetical protein
MIIRDRLINSGTAAHSERSIRYFAQAIRCSRFDVRCIHEIEGHCTFDERKMSLNAIAKVIPKLRHRNANGSAVYVRPNQAFALADDVSRSTIDRMLDDDQKIAAAIRTSPLSYQVWIPLAGPLNPVDPILCVSACERLVVLYDTDPGVAHRDSFGRVPGFFNRKAEYEVDGNWPLVIMDNPLSQFRGYDRTLLDEAERSIDTQPKLLDQRSVGGVQNISNNNNIAKDNYLGLIQILNCGNVIGTYSAISTDTLFCHWLTNMERNGYILPKRSNNTGVDRSQRDLDILRSMYTAGVPYHTALEALEAGSDEAEDKGDRYVNHLISTVWGDH